MRFTFQMLVVVLAVAVAGVWAAAQVRQTQPVPPTVISGADIGFRMEARRGSTPVGKLVVKVDGQWVEAELAAGLKLITR